MKKSIICLMALISIAFIFSSCEKEEESFDQTLLYGKWLSHEYDTEDGKTHEVYYKYLSTGTGTTWDLTEDVREEDAQSFDWVFNKSELKLTHYIGDTPLLPKVYTVTELTASTFKYEDRTTTTPKIYTLTKVAN